MSDLVVAKRSEAASSKIRGLALSINMFLSKNLSTVFFYKTHTCFVTGRCGDCDKELKHLPKFGGLVCNSV